MSRSRDPLYILAKTLIVSQDKAAATTAALGRPRRPTQSRRPMTADSRRMDYTFLCPLLPAYRRYKPSNIDVHDEPLSVAVSLISGGIEASADAVSLFHEYISPTQEQLVLAASLTVTSEPDLPVCFGALWENQRTIICFICHFRCPYCQDFMTSLLQTAPSTQERAAKSPSASLIVISNASYAGICAYRRIFSSPFELFVDPTPSIYRALGTTFQTVDGGTADDCSAFAMRVGNTACARIPDRGYGGHLSQLRSELVFGPGPQCSYAHRMEDMHAQKSVEWVLTEAGVSWKGGNNVQKHCLTNGAKLGVGEMKMDGAHLESLKPRSKTSRFKSNKAKSRARTDQRCSQGDWAAALRASLVVFDRDHPSASLDLEGLSPSDGRLEFNPFNYDALMIGENDEDRRACMTCDSKELSFGERPVVLVAIRTKFKYGRGVIRDLSALNSDKAFL